MRSKAHDQPWPRQDDDYDVMVAYGLRPDRRARRRRPLRRWEIAFVRVLLILQLTFAAVVLVVGPHVPSAWAGTAIGLATNSLFFLATRSGYQLLQLIGLRPSR